MFRLKYLNFGFVSDFDFRISPVNVIVGEVYEISPKGRDEKRESE